MRDAGLTDRTESRHPARQRRRITMNEWINVNDQIPDDDRMVLAVKELKNGTREICLARCLPEYPKYHPDTKTYTEDPYWVASGNNNIVWWMELPGMPEVGE